jgi:hypothetical protein
MIAGVKMKRHIEHYGREFIAAYTRSRKLSERSPTTGRCMDPRAEHYPIMDDSGEVHWNVSWMEDCEEAMQ